MERHHNGAMVGVISLQPTFSHGNVQRIIGIVLSGHRDYKAISNWEKILLILFILFFYYLFSHLILSDPCEAQISIKVTMKWNVVMFIINDLSMYIIIFVEYCL